MKKYNDKAMNSEQYRKMKNEKRMNKKNRKKKR